MREGRWEGVVRQAQSHRDRSCSRREANRQARPRPALFSISLNSGGMQQRSLRRQSYASMPNCRATWPPAGSSIPRSHGPCSIRIAELKSRGIYRRSRSAPGMGGKAADCNPHLGSQSSRGPYVRSACRSRADGWQTRPCVLAGRKSRGPSEPAREAWQPIAHASRRAQWSQAEPYAIPPSEHGILRSRNLLAPCL